MKPSAATLTLETAGAATDRHRQPLGEDWLAVWIGGLSIAIVLAGVRPALPAFAWARAADLTNTVSASLHGSKERCAPSSTSRSDRSSSARASCLTTLCR